MRILEGGFPEDQAWRALLLLSIGERPNAAWKLVQKLAKGYGGELVLASVLPEDSESNVDQVRQTQHHAKTFFGEDVPIYTLIIESNDKRKTLHKIVEQGNIDFVLVGSNSANWPGLNSLRCTVGAVRGEDFDQIQDKKNGEKAAENEKPFKILVPTSAGPNTLHALNLLLGVTGEADVTALYIALEHLGPNEEALGQSRLRQALNFVDANDQFESRLITCDSIISGIVDEAGRGHDLVIIGASQESSLDKGLVWKYPGCCCSSV